MNKINQVDNIVPLVEKIKFFFWFWTGWTLALVLCNTIMR